jgi:hypothetical protein
MSISRDSELILAEEQGVLKRKAGIEKRIEATFGGGDEEEGTLALTKTKLIFVPGRAEEGAGMYRVEATDISDANSIPSNLSATNIQLSSISSVVGHRGELGLPSLEVRWRDYSGDKAVVFHQKMLESGRKKNLSDWALVIQKLQSGEISIASPASIPDANSSLEGKVLAVLSDMQEKGVLQIENEVDKQYEIDTDPDQIEKACNALVSLGLVDIVKDSAENFYRKRSPLGEDDLSS